MRRTIFHYRMTGNALYIFTKNEKGEKVRSNRLDVKFRLLRPRATPPALALPASAGSSRREMPHTGASGATPEEHAAATRLQATFKGRKQRVAFEEKKAHASEFAAYDQATLERSRRMQEREERKAMLKDLPASEVEEWHARQEHDAAVVVQSTFRMHKAKQDVARKRLESRSGPRVLAADPDAADALAASYEPELDDGAFQERTITARPYRQPPPVAQVVAGLKMRHGQNELGLGALTMDEYLRGRRNADEVMREYREFSARAAKAEALRTEKRRLAQASYQKNRAAAHGSLAELPADATAANFPDPAGADPARVRRAHAELLDAARAEQKWWKPLVKLNKEQKVLDEREAERRNRATGVSGF